MSVIWNVATALPTAGTVRDSSSSTRSLPAHSGTSSGDKDRGWARRALCLAKETLDSAPGTNAIRAGERLSAVRADQHVRRTTLVSANLLPISQGSCRPQLGRTLLTRKSRAHAV